jgi:sporulation protein YlmC with PRC-barrel domain
MIVQEKNRELKPIRHWISMKTRATSTYLVTLETYRDTDHFTKLENSMKTFIYIVAVSFLSAAFAGSAFAGDVQEKQQQVQEKQQEVKEQQNELNQARQKESVERTQESNKSMQQVSRASKIIGTKVKNPNEENLGDIKDLVIDPESGQVVYGVVAFGGVLGVGDKLFAIPWDALRWNRVKKYYVLDLDKDTLKKAPGFDKKHWPDTSNKWERLHEELNQFPFYHPKG